MAVDTADDVHVQHEDAKETLHLQQLSLNEPHMLSSWPHLIMHGSCASGVSPPLQADAAVTDNTQRKVHNVALHHA